MVKLLKQSSISLHFETQGVNADYKGTTNANLVNAQQKLLLPTE